MMIEHQIDWEAILMDAANLCEKEFDVSIEIDRDIVREITTYASNTLSSLNMATMPNIAKVAGHFAFWIRKLKPIRHSVHSKNKLLTINEVIGITVGVAICQRYFDDTTKQSFRLPRRIMMDWAMSMRFHSHSPHSCAITFEFLASEN